jgi:hypothetical protein
MTVGRGIVQFFLTTKFTKEIKRQKDLRQRDKETGDKETRDVRGLAL